MVTDYRNRQSLFIDTGCIYYIDIDTNSIRQSNRALYILNEVKPHIMVKPVAIDVTGFLF